MDGSYPDNRPPRRVGIPVLGAKGLRRLSNEDLVDPGDASPRDGDQWGLWVYCDNRTLTHTSGRYEVDLDRATDAPGALGWITQVSGKSWATREDVGALVQAMDFCVGGLQARSRNGVK